YGSSDSLIISVNINLADTSYGWEKFTLSYYWCNDKSCMPHQRRALSKVKELLLTIAYRYTGEAKDGAWEEDLRNLTNTLLDVIVYEFSWFVIPEFTAIENEKYRPRMDWVLEYIIRHYTEKISLSEIARQEHVNANYFSQFLKRTSFGSFTTMTNYVRCLFAERLLLTTDMNMEEIASRCGFSSKNYFHKYFRLECGNTPLQHRKHMLKDISQPDRVEWLPEKETHTLVQDVLCDAILKSNLE
ncbi:MAG: helix-turn-helix transcriptional regulator, partial [Firmicutes bacterium]|nr:helix-turn-helix transcriptional regulator [Bacillota bacterium]